MAILSRLDQLQREVEAILQAPGDAGISARVEELRELIVEKRAKVEEKLDNAD